MLKNSFKVAIRNFFRNPFFTLINLLGLSIGVTFSLALFLVLWDNLKIDQFHEDGEQIYRAYFNGLDENGQFTFTQGSSPYPLFTTLKEMDGVEDAAYLGGSMELVVEVGDKVFKERASWTSPSLFNIFTFPFIEGGLTEAQKNPQSLFISEATAERLFGKDWRGRAVGSTLKVDQQYKVLVAGVYENMGGNSSIHFDIGINAQLLPMLNEEAFLDNWGRKGATVYTKLYKDIDPRGIENQINLIYKEKPGYGIGGDALMLFPFERNFLWTEFEKGVAVGGQILYVRLLLGASIFLLIIACINFINLATAQASKRAKEVGVRKAVGADRLNLLYQFLAETSVLVFVTLGISLFFLNSILPIINTTVGKEITMPLDQVGFWLSILGFGTLITLLAGLYPAFVLAVYKPVSVLKNKLTANYAHKNVRRGLVVFQFVLSSILIIATFVVHQQIKYIQTEKFGLNRSNIIHFNLPDPYSHQYNLLKQKLESHASIQKVVNVTHLPTNINWITAGIEFPGRDPDDGNYFYCLFTDFGFDNMFDIEMKAGRFFDENIQSDSNGVVINEKALAYITMEDPIGKSIREGGEEYTIIGIAKDFNFRSIHNEIEPLLIRMRPGFGGSILLKSEPKSTPEVIALLKNTWKEIIPKFPLEYRFLDDSYASMYRLETAIAKISSALAITAIIISCLGLLGLITFIAAQKTKEIGIRKVLGASMFSIITLLTKDFVRLIVLGLLIAIPIAWYAMKLWLENYAYRIEIKWWVFGLAGFIMVVIGLFTVGIQSIRAATSDPVNSLRNE